jgi:hypothetical protein
LFQNEESTHTNSYKDHRIENLRKICVQNKIKIGNPKGESGQSLEEESM